MAYRGHDDWLGPKRPWTERPLPWWVHQAGGAIVGFATAFLMFA